MSRRDCPNCDGSGNCQNCEGKGEVKRVVVTGVLGAVDDFLGGQGTTKCKKCDGSGKCKRCKGKGHIPVD